VSEPNRGNAEGRDREVDLNELDPALPGQRHSAVVHHALGPASVKVVLALALPTIVEQVLHAVVGLTDTIIAGHLPGDAGVVAAAGAAVGMIAYLQWLAALMTSAFGVGATAIVARSIGARRYRRANRTAGTSLAGAFLVGIVVALLLFIFARQVMWLAGLRGLAVDMGGQYLRIMAITISLQTAAQIGLASLRGAGDTLRPMIVTAIVVVLNIITSLVLAYGWFGLPALGIRGIALGTMLAYMVGGVATVALLMSGWTRLRLRPRHLKLAFPVLRRVLSIGTPSWLEGMLLWLGQFLIVAFVINPTDRAVGLPGATMAAHNAVLRIESIAFLPGFGFGIAASALVGQYLGARRPDEARHAARLANWIACATMTLLAIPMVLFPGTLLRLLIDSPPVVQIGYWPMVLAGLAQPGFAVAIIMGAALKGAGETVQPMVSTITGTFIVRIPVLLALLWIFAAMGHRDWGLIAVWVGIFADLNYRAVHNSILFLRGNWQRKKV
jgi:multidrug resistance protein, MATE family